ncbi:MAG: prepilin-type N-terminal cleavage/methylation domain-containing protein [Actinobacteria bacterium]|nr:prepilin-type N-terminal cleavage/methylation domain-containing protein [Actinomycetota bacterium]
MKHAVVPRRRSGSKVGFTLLEVVVALAITGLLVGAVYAAIAAAIGAHDRNRALQEALRRERNTRMIVSALLRSARLDPATPETAFFGSDGGTRGDEIAFSSVLGVSLAGWEGGEQVRVRLWGGRDGLLLELAPEHGAGNADTLLLLSSVAGVEARYRDPGSGEWLHAWTRREALPDAVALAFVAEPPIPALLVEVAAVAVPARARTRPQVGEPTHPAPEAER